MADNDPINSAIELQYQELLEKYNALLGENKCLKEENRRFKTQLGLSPSEPSEKHATIISAKTSCNDASTDESFYLNINHASDAAVKIEMFMSLFNGRDDVYAVRWENKKKGTFGYAPVCLNQWQTGVCNKPRLPCSKCAHKQYAVVDELVIEDHLRGNLVAGIYPMLPDETCCFLAMDFDKEGWQNDVSKVREVCVELSIPVSVE